MPNESSDAGVSENALESARVSLSRGSDCSAVLEACLRVMDEAQIDAVVPQVSE